jgi:antirestriction protein ArdC
MKNMGKFYHSVRDSILLAMKDAYNGKNMFLRKLLHALMYVVKTWKRTKVHVSRLITAKMRVLRSKWKEKPEKRE